MALRRPRTISDPSDESRNFKCWLTLQRGGLRKNWRVVGEVFKGSRKVTVERRTHKHLRGGRKRELPRGGGACRNNLISTIIRKKLSELKGGKRNSKTATS